MNHWPWNSGFASGTEESGNGEWSRFSQLGGYQQLQDQNGVVMRRRDLPTGNNNNNNNNNVVGFGGFPVVAPNNMGVGSHELEVGGRRWYSGGGDQYENGYWCTADDHDDVVEYMSAGIISCLVEGCGKDLRWDKHYYKRHRVCEFHGKAAVVLVEGSAQRFCQQCSRFEVLSEFDDDKRSCRKRLADHNRRRRRSTATATAISARPTTSSSSQIIHVPSSSNLSAGSDLNIGRQTRTAAASSSSMVIITNPMLNTHQAAAAGLANNGSVEDQWISFV